MKKLNLKVIIPILGLIVAAFIIGPSCNIGGPPNLPPPATATCNSNFMVFQNKDISNIATDTYRVHTYQKNNTLDTSVAPNVSGANAFQASGFLQYGATIYDSATNLVYNYLPNHNRLIKYNKSSGTFTNTSILSGLRNPFLLNGNLMFLKFTNITNTNIPSSFQTYISSYNVQIFNESGVASGSVYTLNFTQGENAQIDENSPAIVVSNKVFFLTGGCIGVIDLTSNTAQAKTIYGDYNYDNKRYFTRGLKYKDDDNFVVLKLGILPTSFIQVNIINVNNLLNNTTSNYSPAMVLNTTTATYSGNVTYTVASMINKNEYWSCAFDKCDDSYYIGTYEINPNNSALTDSWLLELKPNSNQYNYRGIGAGSNIFGIEIQQF